jgi:hypothetical protein
MGYVRLFEIGLETSYRAGAGKENKSKESKGKMERASCWADIVRNGEKKRSGQLGRCG